MPIMKTADTSHEVICALPSSSSSSSGGDFKIESMVNWTFEDIWSLVAQVKNRKEDGLSIDVGFEPQPWKAISASFSDPGKDEESCRRIWLKLKKEYHEFKFFLKVPGFTITQDGLPIAESHVREELEKRHPEIMNKWGATPFPWVHSIMYILDDVNVEPEIEILARKSKFHTRFLKGSDEFEYEEGGHKRQREISPVVHKVKKLRLAAKKPKMTSAEEMNKDLEDLVEELSKSSPSTIHTTDNLKENDPSEIIWKATLGVWNETCLTKPGTLYMVDLVRGSTTMAKKYMSFRKDSMRIDWMKKQLEGSGKRIKSLYIE